MRIKRYTPEMEQWIKDNSTLKPWEDYDKFCTVFNVKPEYKAYLLRRHVLGCADPKANRIVWDDEKIAWIKANNTTKPREDWTKFCTVFPPVTYQAYLTMRSRLGLKTRKQKGSKAPRIKKNEVEKGKYLYIRTDHGYEPKSRVVYCEYHPEYVYTKGDNIVFLDGDRRNFNKGNLAVVYAREKSIFQLCGGVVKGQPNLTRINILKARLKVKTLDAGEKLGLVYRNSAGRHFK